MRLTLRTLLAYVDDTLPPDQAREIGQKVAESHVAQELMERIKKVTRRRGLTVPPVAGPDRIDANTVGEYLDNDLPADRVAEVEEMALNSDVHLAEVAACHQILTLVLGEPAHVPPTARERMYGLVQGKESEPHRRASRIGPPAFPGETETADDLRAARRGLGYRLLGACILGIALAVAIWQALPSRHPASKAGAGEASVDSGVQPDLTPPPEPKPDIKAIEPEPKPPVAPPTPPPTPDRITPPVAPKPPVVKPPDRSPSTQRKAAGQFASKDAVLLSQVGKDWVKIAPDAKIDTTVPIMALPGSHAELKLDTGARVTLWGGLPETTGWKVLDCQVTLHVPPAGYDLDCTVDHGRVYLGTVKMSGPTKARVRFAGQIWDLTLKDDQTEVMIEVSRLFAGEPFKKDVKDISPRTDVTLAVLDGEAQVTADSKTYDLSALPGPAELHWDSKVKGPLKPVELETAPAAWAKTLPKFPRERQLEIDAAQQKLVQRLGEKGKSVDIALAEVAQDANRASKVLGVLGQGAIGSLPQLLDALEEPQFPEAPCGRRRGARRIHRSRTGRRPTGLQSTPVSPRIHSPPNRTGSVVAPRFQRCSTFQPGNLRAIDRRPPRRDGGARIGGMAIAANRPGGSGSGPVQFHRPGSDAGEGRRGMAAAHSAGETAAAAGESAGTSGPASAQPRLI